MNFLKNIFSKKDTPIRSNEDFWNWFKANEKAFFSAVKSRTNIEKDFFDHLMPKLNELKKGYFFLSGMSGPDIAELVLTADGDIKNIAFVEDLVASAPKIDGWLFTALKPPMDIKNVIEMGGYQIQQR